MKLAPLLFLAALAGCEARPAVTFADAAITLPDDPLDLPPGPGRQAVLENCTACHSPSTMLQQPRLSRAKWEANVTKMIEVYKAPIDEAATLDIVNYFMAVQVKPEAAPQIGAPAAAEGS